MNQRKAGTENKKGLNHTYFKGMFKPILRPANP